MSDFIKLLNVFDIFANLIPGTICLTFFCILLPPNILMRWYGLPDEKYIVFFILCYSYGMFLNGAFNTIKQIIKNKYDCNRIYYRKKWIYKDKGTKKLAEKLIKQIKKERIIIDGGKLTKINPITDDDASYAIKYMFTQLNMSKNNARKDKLSALSDMNGVMALGIFIVFIYQLVLKNQNVKYTLLGYNYRLIILFIIFLILVCRCCDYQHHRYVQTIMSYDILVNNNKQKSQKEYERHGYSV